MDGERREDQRRVLRVRAFIEVQGEQLYLRTHDIGLQGMALLLPFPVKPGISARIRFSLFHDGRLQEVIVVGKAMHCTLSADTFRTGFLFTDISPAHQKIVATYCKDR